MNKKSFCGGVVTGVVSAAVAFSVLSFASVGIMAGGRNSFSKEDKLGYISALLNTYYVDDIDSDKLLEGACEGLVAGVGDPYTTYMSKETVENFMSATNGEFYGIGVGLLFNSEDGSTVVSYLMDNSPAGAAGVMPGDKLIKVNGKSISGMDSDSIVSMVRGPKGTTVELGIYRSSDNKEYTFKITRDIIDIQSVKGEVLDGDIGYIYLSGFKNNTYDQFMSNYSKLKEQGIKGLIIDVRDNPGGLLNIVEKIADELVPEGSVVYTVDKHGNRKDFNADSNYIDIPLVMLVNGNSASASEILAGAVQDRGRGKLVGTQTFGKGLVQNLYSIPDGSAVKITIEKYYTPKGVCIQGVGITPDYVVERNDNLASVLLLEHKDDVQLSKALEVIKGEVN
ncbi:S41 family peptidase [Lachnospiraceae bacterium NSJ-143]|nr:S41 family peptidase [Lachnospiraceae bacterium NSJ-143]